MNTLDPTFPLSTSQMDPSLKGQLSLSADGPRYE